MTLALFNENLSKVSTFNGFFVIPPVMKMVLLLSRQHFDSTAKQFRLKDGCLSVRLMSTFWLTFAFKFWSLLCSFETEALIFQSLMKVNYMYLYYKNASIPRY